MLVFQGSKENMWHKNMAGSHNTRGFENLALSFLMARRIAMLRQQPTPKIKRPAPEKYAYLEKGNDQIIYLTPRQHQCLCLYHQYKNIKLVAEHLNFSERAAEEHLKCVRKKFRVQKLKLLVEAMDHRFIELASHL